MPDGANASGTHSIILTRPLVLLTQGLDTGVVLAYFKFESIPTPDGEEPPL